MACNTIATKDPDDHLTKRWMQHMTSEDAYFQYNMWTELEEPASDATVRMAFEQRWRKSIGWRKQSQHARCSECVCLHAKRKLAKTDEQRQKVQADLEYHLRMMYADRETDERAIAICERSMTPELGELHRILRLSLDGMDRAKFRVPRNLASNTQFEDLWRPQLSMIGAIIPGLVEAYFVLDADVPKDPNTNMTVISRMLEISSKKLEERSTTLPEHWVIKADNTCREGKNQHLAKFSAYNVCSGKARSVNHPFSRVGHTHNEVDERFHVVTTVLKATQEMQTPEAFMDRIVDKVKPIRNCCTHVEKLEATWDFKRLFEILGVAMSGLVPWSG